MKPVSQNQLPPEEELLEEFKSGSIPRSETWQTLIHGLYLNNEQVAEIEEWYNTILVLSEQNETIHAEIQVRYEQIEIWHGNVDLWQQQVSAEKDIAVNSAASAKASEQAAAGSENRAKASETAAADSASKAADSESNALASKNAAANSATDAAGSENKAKASETAAADSASKAASSEGKAKVSETAAAGSEGKAKASEIASADSATKASSSEDKARVSEVNSKASEDKSKKWANEDEDVEVEPGEYSSYHWAKKAESFIPTDVVLSVNGKIGNVTLTASDVGAVPESYIPAWGDISGKPSSYPPSSHKHDWDDIKNPPNAIELGAIFIGEIREFSFEDPPDGFFALDGSTVTNGKNDFPKLIASNCQFISVSGSDIILADAKDFRRGKGSTSRKVGEHQGDAIRNIWGERIIGDALNWGNPDESFTGAFYDGTWNSLYRSQGTNGNGFRLGFDASRIVPTASENRPSSNTVLVCLYHGEGV